MGLDSLGRALQAYTFFNGDPPNIDDEDLIAYVREGLSEISGKTSGKDPIIGGIRLLAERRVQRARQTFETALRDSNQSVREEARRALTRISDLR